MHGWRTVKNKTMKKEVADTSWAKLAGKILGQITAVWFACMVAVVVLTPPTKVIVWSVKWFWNLW